MRLHQKLMSAALSLVLAIAVSGACTTQLLAQDANKSSKRSEQADKNKKKSQAKQPATSRARNANTGSSAAPSSQPAFPVDGY